MPPDPSPFFSLVGFTGTQASFLGLIFMVYCAVLGRVVSYIKSLCNDVKTAASKAVEEQFAKEMQHSIYAHIRNQTATTTPQNISYITPAPAPTSGQQTNEPQQSPIQSFSNSSSPHRRT